MSITERALAELFIHNEIEEILRENLDNGLYEAILNHDRGLMAKLFSNQQFSRILSKLLIQGKSVKQLNEFLNK